MPKAQIFYFNLNDETRRQEKLDWLRHTPLKSIDFEKIIPDEKGNWLNQTENDFETLLPIASKEVKNNKAGKEADKAIFKLYSLGVVTNRDEWVYDFNEKDLEKKVRFFCEFYEKEIERWQKSDKSIPINDFVDRTIKWTEELENHLKKGSKLSFDENKITIGLYRPYVKSFLYFDKIITHRVYQHDTIFGIEKRNENKVICFSISSRLPTFSVFASDKIPSLALYVEPTQCLPLYRYDENGNRIENITDWSLEQFKKHYALESHILNLISKESIFKKKVSLWSITTFNPYSVG
jgi:predicted helicase